MLKLKQKSGKVNTQRIRNPQKSKLCRACGLYLNQFPIFDIATTGLVFWVGLSAVSFSDSQLKLPLSPDTRSGKLIEQVEKANPYIEFYKTNIVKCLPLNNDKIRYPSKLEMDKCYVNLDYEFNQLNPKIVFLLGKQVSQYVLKRYNITDFSLDRKFNYKSFRIDKTNFIPIHHPSFVLIYKRNHIDNYLKGIKLCIKNYA